jgi:hypothetical protein
VIALTLTKMQFDNLVWPALAQTGPKGLAEMEAGLSLLAKLEEHEHTKREDLPRDEAAEAAGRFRVADLVLLAPEAEFAFTPAEQAYLVVALRGWASSGRVNLAAARAAMDIVRLLGSPRLKQEV